MGPLYVLHKIGDPKPKDRLVEGNLRAVRVEHNALGVHARGLKGHRNWNGLQPHSDGLQSNSDGDGLQVRDTKIAVLV